MRHKGAEAKLAGEDVKASGGDFAEERLAGPSVIVDSGRCKKSDHHFSGAQGEY